MKKRPLQNDALESGNQNHHDIDMQFDEVTASDNSNESDSSNNDETEVDDQSLGAGFFGNFDLKPSTRKLNVVAAQQVPVSIINEQPNKVHLLFKAAEVEEKAEATNKNIMQPLRVVVSPAIFPISAMQENNVMPKNTVENEFNNDSAEIRAHANRLERFLSALKLELKLNDVDVKKYKELSMNNSPAKFSARYYRNLYRTLMEEKSIPSDPNMNNGQRIDLLSKFFANYYPRTAKIFQLEKNSPIADAVDARASSLRGDELVKVMNRFPHYEENENEYKELIDEMKAEAKALCFSEQKIDWYLGEKKQSLMFRKTNPENVLPSRLRCETKSASTQVPDAVLAKSAPVAAITTTTTTTSTTTTAGTANELASLERDLNNASSSYRTLFDKYARPDVLVNSINKKTGLFEYMLDLPNAGGTQYTLNTLVAYKESKPKLSGILIRKFAFQYNANSKRWVNGDNLSPASGELNHFPKNPQANQIVIIGATAYKIAWSILRKDMPFPGVAPKQQAASNVEVVKRPNDANSPASITKALKLTADSVVSLPGSTQTSSVAAQPQSSEQPLEKLRISLTPKAAASLASPAPEVIAIDDFDAAFKAAEQALLDAENEEIKMVEQLRAAELEKELEEKRAKAIEQKSIKLQELQEKIKAKRDSTAQYGVRLFSAQSAIQEAKRLVETKAAEVREKMQALQASVPSTIAPR